MRSLQVFHALALAGVLGVAACSGKTSAEDGGSGASGGEGGSGTKSTGGGNSGGSSGAGGGASGGASGAGGRLSSAVPPDDVELSIIQVMSPQPPECTVRADPSAFSWSRGRLDVLFTTSYGATLLVRHDGDSIERLSLREARMFVNGDELSVAASGFLDGERRFILTAIDLIPATVVSEVSATLDPGQSTTLTVEVQVLAETTDGRTVGSQVFTFPVDVCTGCLIAFPPAADDPALPGYQCTLYMPPGSPELTTPCRLGQDDAIDCRVCCSAFTGSDPYRDVCACDY